MFSHCEWQYRRAWTLDRSSLIFSAGMNQTKDISELKTFIYNSSLLILGCLSLNIHSQTCFMFYVMFLDFLSSFDLNVNVTRHCWMHVALNGNGNGQDAHQIRIPLMSKMRFCLLFFSPDDLGLFVPIVLSLISKVQVMCCQHLPDPPFQLQSYGKHFLTW